MNFKDRVKAAGITLQKAKTAPPSLVNEQTPLEGGTTLEKLTKLYERRK
jgi:hypothetical protein